MTQLALEDDFLVWCADIGLELWISRRRSRFCGADIFQSRDFGNISINIDQYTRNVKPIVVEKARGQTPDSECTPKEVSAPRSLIGALQWPAAQRCPHLSATLSFLQAKMSRAVVLDL